MSELYRDDVHEIIGFTNNTVSKTKTLVDVVSRIGDETKHHTMHQFADSILIQDDVMGFLRISSYENLAISDHIVDKKIQRHLIEDSILISENLKTKLRVKSFVYDTLGVGQDDQDKLKQLSTEYIHYNESHSGKKIHLAKTLETVKLLDILNSKAIIRSIVQGALTIEDFLPRLSVRTKHYEVIALQELWQGKNHTRTNIIEQIKIKDLISARYRDDVLDGLSVLDVLRGKARFKQHIDEQLNYQELQQQKRKALDRIIEQLTFDESATTKLLAKQVIDEHIFAEDDYTALKGQGYAWTANFDNWAMSRYQEYPYDDLVVIDGVLYGLSASGMYRLDAVDEHINATIETGLIDLGAGGLVHPLASYLEYSLAGENKALSVTVGTTQLGQLQKYTYNMVSEQANYLTNGRVVFGRGLRGRHFSFTYQVQGTYGDLNEITIDLAATKRSV